MNLLVVSEFEGVAFTTDIHPQYYDGRQSMGAHAEIMVGLDRVRAFHVLY
jgi:hypothetical protein